MGAEIPDLASIEDLADFIEHQRHLIELLEGVRTLRLPDCWIGAGLLRNAVWDALHGISAGALRDSDVDVIYFDPIDNHPDRDRALEQHLLISLPGVPWSVRNQARMHERNGDRPYNSTEDAVRRWPETATAIAARLAGTRVTLLAPHGIDDLVSLIVRPTPAFTRKLDQYRARITAKNWAATWPRLTIIDA